MIPKKIYYVWFGPKEIPLQLKEYIEGWKKMNPDYSIYCINESNFDVDKYDFTKKAYKDKKWAFVSDYARLKIIYEKGGFYLDTDVQLLKNLNQLEKYPSVWALEDSDAINSGLIIGSEAKNENIKNIISIYDSIDYSKTEEKDLITVPIVTNYFLQKGFKIKNKKQILKDGTLILPTDYFAPFHFWGGGHITKRTIGIHKYAASWTDHKKTYASRKFAFNREFMLVMPKLYISLRNLYRKIK